MSVSFVRCLPVAAFGVLSMIGCGAETIALAGAAGNAARSGGSAYSSGKAIAAVRAPFDEVNNSVRRTAGSFGYHIEIDRLSDDGHRQYILFRDDRGGAVSVRTDRRTVRFTRVEVNAGWFGHQPTARRLMSDILLPWAGSASVIDAEHHQQPELDQDHTARGHEDSPP